MGKAFDVIVVGARCAGSPTAMLLARKGYRVLVVDRASFPSDTVSTHILHPLGVGALSRWGLLDRLVATGCPPIHTYSFDFGPFTHCRRAGHRRESARLLPAADDPRQAAGRRRSRIRRGDPRGFHRRGDHDRRRARRRHQGPIKAGRRPSRSTPTSSSAPTAGIRWWARRFSPNNTTKSRLCWRATTPIGAGCRWTAGLKSIIRDRRGFAAAPTHDDLTLVIAGWPYAEFAENKKDIEGNYLKTIDLAPDFRRAPAQCEAGSAVCRRGGAELFPQALRPRLGARGRCRLQQGLHHRAGDYRCVPRRRALRDGARRVFLGSAAVRGCDGRLSARPGRAGRGDVRLHLRAGDAGAAAARAAAAASAAVHGNQAAMDGFARLNAGTISPTEFFAPDNVDAIFAAADSRARCGCTG